MKKIHNITVLAFMLAGSALAPAQTTEPIQNQREISDNFTTTDNNSNGGLWGLVGLLGFLGLLKTRRSDNRDHNQVRTSGAH